MVPFIYGPLFAACETGHVQVEAGWGGINDNFNIIQLYRDYRLPSLLSMFYRMPSLVRI